MKKQKKLGMLVLCTALLLPAFILGQTTETSAKTNADVIFLGQTMPKSKTCLYLCLAFES